MPDIWDDDLISKVGHYVVELDTDVVELDTGRKRKEVRVSKEDSAQKVAKLLCPDGQETAASIALYKGVTEKADKRKAFIKNVKDNYNIEITSTSLEDGSFAIKYEEILRDSGTKDLYDAALKEFEDSTKARRAFIEHMESIYDQMKELTGTDEKRAANPEEFAKTFSEIFNDSTTRKLYAAAIKEEKNSIAFRNAVFLHSSHKFGKKKWKDRLALWIPGPSGAGKTFSAEKIIKSLDSSMAGEEGGENSVIFVDGASDRQVSQMRQIMLRAALKKGYSGISDLDDVKTAVKSHVMKAAELSPSMHLCVPSTFNSKVPYISGSALKSKFSEYREKGFKQVMAVVQEAPGKESRFKRNILTMGKFRAYLRKKYSGAIGFDSLDIGCESKAHGGSSSYDLGRYNARRAKKEFTDNVPDGVVIDVANDLIRLKLNEDRMLCECQEGDVEQWKVSELEFEAYILSNGSYKGNDFSAWLKEYRALHKDDGPRILSQQGALYSPFPGYERKKKKADGGGQAKSSYTGYYQDADGTEFFIKHTANKRFTGDDVAEVISSSIARGLLGSSASIFAECMPIRSFDGQVYVKSRCAQNWTRLYKHGTDKYGFTFKDRFGKNFVTSLRDPRTRKTKDGDPRHFIYEDLGRYSEDGGPTEREQLGKGLAACLLIMDHDCHTENVGRSAEGIVKIDHGWGLVNILKDKHKKVDPYVFKNLRGKRGGNVRNTPTNHLVDYPDILAGIEFIDAIDSLYEEFHKQGKEALQESIRESVLGFIKCYGNDKEKQIETLKFFMKHIQFNPKLIDPEARSIDDLKKPAGIEHEKTWVNIIASQIANRMEMRLESMNLYKYVLNYKHMKDSEPKRNKKSKVKEFKEVCEGMAGISKALSKISALEHNSGVNDSEIKLDDYICEECCKGLEEMLRSMADLVKELEIDKSKMAMLDKLERDMDIIKRAAARGKKYNGVLIPSIGALEACIKDKRLELEEAGYLADDEMPMPSEEADTSPIGKHISRAHDVVRDMGRYAEDDEHITSRARRIDRSTRTNVSLKDHFNIEEIKTTLQQKEPRVEFKTVAVNERFTEDRVLVGYVQKITICHDTNGVEPTKVESASLNPEDDELHIFAKCIISSGCKEPKFKTGNTRDLIKVLEYLKKDGYECSPLISARLLEQASETQIAHLEELCEDLQSLHRRGGRYTARASDI